MDTAKVVRPYTGENSVSADRVVPAINDLARAIEVITEQRGLTPEETAHVVGRICEQFIEEVN